MAPADVGSPQRSDLGHAQAQTQHRQDQGMVAGTFRLLFQFIKQQTGREPAAFHITDLDAAAILSFLDSLEQRRHNSVRSRNVRLAAIRTFFRWVALREPEHINLATRVLSIPVKRAEKKIVQAVTREEMEALLKAPDLSSRQGRRDHALLLTLYNSGA